MEQVSFSTSRISSSPTYSYVYARYIDEPVFRYKPAGTESICFHCNQHYSIVALTDGSGAIVERYAYSAYGVLTIADASGSVLSASAYGNRYHGRWISGHSWLLHSEGVLFQPRGTSAASTLGLLTSQTEPMTPV